MLKNLRWKEWFIATERGNAEAEQRVRSELEIIHRLGFSAYFLIAWDIIRYSMSLGFYHVGRGSGANSVVVYCLRITDADPIELNLYFERFIKPKTEQSTRFRHRLFVEGQRYGD